MHRSSGASPEAWPRPVAVELAEERRIGCVPFGLGSPGEPVRRVERRADDATGPSSGVGGCTTVPSQLEDQGRARVVGALAVAVVASALLLVIVHPMGESE